MILESPYSKPKIYPVKKMHPRVLINEEMLPKIKNAMENEESIYAVKKYKKLVDLDFDLEIIHFDNYLDLDFDGRLDTTITTGTNFNGFSLCSIEAKALEYQLNGDKNLAYKAIEAIKNFINSLIIIDKVNDTYRIWGMTMLIAGEVYDWCYDLLSDKDKEEIISGVENKLLAEGHMEIGFPPCKQSCVSSHGSEAQLLRDYLGFSIAIFDERPDFWEYVGGRFYEEYVTFRNYYYESGTSPQGTGLYGLYRHNFDLWSAWIIKTMSGKIPYSDNLEKVVISYLSSELPLDKELFATGDYYGIENIKRIDNGGDDASTGKEYGISTFLFHSALFNNGTSRAASKYYSNGFSGFTYQNNYLNPVTYLILTSSGTKTASNRHEGLPTILSNGAPVGMITTREMWDNPNSAAVMMKLGERTTANHDHQDAGSFEIYYKGKLAFDSGVYSGYGSNHHFYYHQATIAHNSLLIYNPKYAETDRGLYSGGQKLLSESSGMENWLSDKYKIGKITAQTYAYSNGEGSRPKYAYLAGDITPAYNAETVTEVERRMLSIYTDNKVVPVIFAVYDNISAESGDFKKTFLLHTPTEPSINGNKVVEVNGEGTLTLFNLLGGDSITKMGGPDQNYLVNGVQNSTNSIFASDGMWGRIEISPKIGNKTDKMLNVMFVSDTGVNIVEPTRLKTEDFDGFNIANYAVFFAKTSSLINKTESIELNCNSKEVNYYFSGVEEGIWLVKVNGNNIGEFNVGEKEHLLTFCTTSGTIEISLKK